MALARNHYTPAGDGELRAGLVPPPKCVRCVGLSIESACVYNLPSPGIVARVTAGKVSGGRRWASVGGALLLAAINTRLVSVGTGSLKSSLLLYECFRRE